MQDWYCSSCLDYVTKHSIHPLTERELKADRPFSNFPVNHGGLKQRTKQQEALIVVCINLDTETSSCIHCSEICTILFLHNLHGESNYPSGDTEVSRIFQ